MKKYVVKVKDVSVKIDKERAIKLKALQTFYKQQETNKNVSYKEIYKQIKEDMEKEEKEETFEEFCKHNIIIY